MIPEQYVSSTLIIGLWFTVVGYYFLLFFYLTFFKWRKDRNLFHLSLAVFFITLAIGRGFFIVYDFYARPWIIPLTLGAFSSMTVPYPQFVPAVFTYSPWSWRLGSFWQWVSVAFIVLGTSYVWFENKWVRRTLHIPPFIIAALLILLPENMLFGYGIDTINLYMPPFSAEPYEKFLVWLGFDPFSPYFPLKCVIAYQPSGTIYLTINYVLASLYSIFVPLLFFYIAWQGVGVIRRKALLMGFGFTTYYIGRAVQAAIIKAMLGEWVIFLAPMIVFLSLILITAGVQYEAE
ncbi:MAG: hypothetical protein ACTSWP_11205 [Candidatus Freyarchaeota archaeon]|nr:hypothetical protein [Candidatus Freyrarchaeum guaymaensis]